MYVYTSFHGSSDLCFWFLFFLYSVIKTPKTFNLANHTALESVICNVVAKMIIFAVFPWMAGIPGRQLY